MPQSENTMGGWFIVATSDSPTCHLFAVQLELDSGAFNVKQKQKGWGKWLGSKLLSNHYFKTDKSILSFQTERGEPKLAFLKENLIHLFEASVGTEKYSQYEISEEIDKIQENKDHCVNLI